MNIVLFSSANQQILYILGVAHEITFKYILTKSTINQTLK